MPDIPEISDLITDYDASSLVRRDVSKAEVVARFATLGDTQAMRIVDSMPADANGFLVPEAVDMALIRSHRELQRLHEEFFLGHRVLEVLVPMIRVLRRASPESTVRVVDVGSGLGYLVWRCSIVVSRAFGLLRDVMGASPKGRITELRLGVV